MSEFTYVEVAVGDPQNRGSLIPRKQLPEIIAEHADKSVYRSMYLYNNAGKEYADMKNSIAGYTGERDIDKIVIDIDKEDNTDEDTLHIVRALCMELEDYGLVENNFQVFFSGSGYHISIPNTVFQFEPSADLPFQVKSTMKELFPHIDLSIYQRAGIYRLPHTKNKKTGLYKIPLHLSEVYHNSPDDIIQCAKEPRLDFPYSKPEGSGEMQKYVLLKKPERKAMNTVREPKKIVPCIQRMYRKGPVEGSRHITILRIASHYRRNGIPFDACVAALERWAEDEEDLDTEEIERIVTGVYNRGYKYSCQDKLMAQHCSPQCIYFKRKDYMIDVLSHEDMQEKMVRKLETDYTGRTLNLGELSGIKHKELIAYPGELVTLFGPTGVNKTTYAQNLVLGFDAINEEVRKELQIETLWLSLELSPEMMHRRNIQIAGNFTPEEVKDDPVGTYNQVKDKLNHVVIQTVSPTMEQILEKIRSMNPALIVVDYVELVEPPKYVRGEYEQLNKIAHGLRNMAVNEDVIILLISQISRDNARKDNLDIYSAKGSGAMENASAKVMGIHGKQEERYREVELYKNSDGDLFGVALEFQPSYRLTRTTRRVRL